MCNKTIIEFGFRMISEWSNLVSELSDSDLGFDN